jgi:hypothetical protein
MISAFPHQNISAAFPYQKERREILGKGTLRVLTSRGVLIAGSSRRNSTAGVAAPKRFEMSKSRSWCLPWRRRSAQSRLTGRDVASTAAPAFQLPTFSG